MPTITSHINYRESFAKLHKDYHQAAREAVYEAAKVGGAKAASVAATRPGKTGDMADIRVSSPIRTYRGWQASFISPTYYAWFQNWGTLGNRTRALRGPPRGTRTREPGTGIKPLYFLDQGRDAGRRHLNLALRKRL